MLTPTEEELIDQVQYEEDLSKCVDIVKNSSNPCFLFEYAQTHNWDDGLDIANAIADNTYCDLGTALSLFWLAEGMSYLNGDIEKHEHNTDWVNFCESLSERLSNNHYKIGPVSFNPGLNRIQVHKLSKTSIPKILFTEVQGTDHAKR